MMALSHAVSRCPHDFRDLEILSDGRPEIYGLRRRSNWLGVLKGKKHRGGSFALA